MLNISGSRSATLSLCLLCLLLSHSLAAAPDAFGKFGVPADDGHIKIVSKVLNATKSGLTPNYREVVGSEFLKLTQYDQGDAGFFVFFGATWCGHCKTFKPIYKNASDIAATMPGEQPLFIYYQVEANDYPSQLFKVKGYPTIMYIRKGEFWEYTAGRTEDQMFEWVTKIRKGEGIEGSAYPELIPPFIEDIYDNIKEIKTVMKHYYETNTLVFSVIVGLFVFLVGLCGLTIHQLVTDTDGSSVSEQEYTRGRKQVSGKRGGKKYQYEQADDKSKED